MAESDRQSRVTAAIWPWRDSDNRERSDNPAARRKRALAESGVMLCVGLAILFLLGKRLAGTIVLVLAVSVFVSGLFVPVVYNGFKKLGNLLASTVGVVLSWVLLAPFFYVCFTFGRIILVVSGNDPLHRKFPGDTKSYWVTRRVVSGLERYSRQY